MEVDKLDARPQYLSMRIIAKGLSTGSAAITLPSSLRLANCYEREISSRDEKIIQRTCIYRGVVIPWRC